MFVCAPLVCGCTYLTLTTLTPSQTLGMPADLVGKSDGRGQVHGESEHMHPQDHQGLSRRGPAGYFRRRTLGIWYSVSAMVVLLLILP